MRRAQTGANDLLRWFVRKRVLGTIGLTIAIIGGPIAVLSRAGGTCTTGVSTLSDYVRLSVKGKCHLGGLPC